MGVRSCDFGKISEFLVTLQQNATRPDANGLIRSDIDDLRQAGAKKSATVRETTG